MNAYDPGMAEDLLGIADELYALPLGEFTAARDARAKELKGTDLAAAVKALRKPSLAAWVVNLLVRRDAEQATQVLELGAALRDAAAGMQGDELRALTRQRRQLTAAVTTGARTLASAEGVKVTAAVADQVEATLTAAMLDARCADAVRSGLLVTALASTGVGEVDLGNAVATPDALGFTPAPVAPVVPSRPELHLVPDPDADEKARAAAAEEVEEAAAALTVAQSDLADAAATVADLEARSMQLQAEIDEVKRRLAELDTAYDEVEEELAEAEDARTEAADEVTTAERDHATAVSALARLEG